MKKNEVNLLPINLLEITSPEENPPSNILDIGSRYKWSQGYTGKGVVVAVIDTGCDTNHPDLKDRIIGGYNFTEEYGGDISIFEDTNGHGTHVAGIIAGSINGKGIVGVAPNAKLLILKVLDQFGSGSINSLVEAIHYAVDWRGPAGERVKIISLSLGTRNPSSDLYDAVKRAVAHDISVVAASGNDGDGNIETNEYRYPGAYKEVIEVGAINKLNEIAYFSNTNESVDLYAPGVKINSAYLKNGYAVLSGTSMATPHVAGAIALLIEEYEGLFRRELKEIEIYQLLMEHTTPIKVSRNKEIYLLNLEKKPNSKREGGKEMETRNREMLLKCFCEARRTQAFFTKCLDENSSNEEREFLLELVKESAKTSNKIMDFCKII
ncbi:major intracellular serine protease [Anoxybacillus calidus]|jgi:major intracellular serine protease|uniref:Major intracellular serine protease n=1 Tax=[Anoxybacillus] calidus TaxID=575178 RepID=A0A7V9Z072_9BACL|nr:S8 family peptidase [Anoxybacillus calidus]MBA2871542.1 major intracellular serine protease [Anoxybacillus calidus]